mgnify:CR=1 FL=1
MEIVIAETYKIYSKKFAVANVTIVIDVIDFKGKFKFLFVSAYERNEKNLSWSLPVEERVLRPLINSKNEIFPSLFLSRTAITLLTRGF